jgi:drug/metabolite transporter (DMT)-like permease
MGAQIHSGGLSQNVFSAPAARGELVSIVTITLAIVFLKEKVTKLQGAGMAAAIAGIILTAF